MRSARSLWGRLLPRDTWSVSPVQRAERSRAQLEIGNRVIRWGVPLLAVGAHVAAAAFFSQHDPYSSQIFPECPWRHITGWECPGCGGTRALYSLFRGDVFASITMNPIVVASYAAALLLGAQAIAGAISKRTARWPEWLALLLIVTSALYAAIFRNL
jgi:hypothetical protein